jgi:DHA2 family metal-tetracycline-proton antiporter-like MFS transporter
VEKETVTTAKDPRKLVPWLAYLIFFAVLNETVFNVSTPAISAQFRLTPSGVSWMMTVFMVFFGVGGVIFGKLSDIFSLRSLIRAGVLLYVGASLAGFLFRSSYAAVVAARALQGIGGSAIPALVFVVIARHFEESERGGIFGLITSVVSLAIGFGPVIGGLVASRLHWSFLFLIPVLILFALPFIGAILRAEARKKGGVDILGAILATAVVGSLVAFLNLGGLAFFAAFALLAALFAARMLRAKDPFIKPSLLTNAAFRGGLLFAFAVFAIVIGIVFLVPLMLSRVHGIGAAQIGLVLFPGAISSVVFGPIAGKLADRRGSSFVIGTGLALLVGGMAVMSLFLGFSPLAIAFAMLLTYVGFALFQTAIVNAISQTLPPEEMGVGMGLFNLTGTLSGAIGAAIVGRLLDGGALEFSLLPYDSPRAGYPFSNLAITFALLTGLAGLAYFRTRGVARRAAPPVGQESPGAPDACLEAAGC